MLRIGNSILKAMGKTHNLELRGKILIFLASKHELTDKSGLNLKSKINENS